MKRYRWIGAVLGGALLVGASAPVAQAFEEAGQPAAQRWVVASGRVVDPKGRPQPGNEVTLVAWPSELALRAQKVGEELPLTIVDRVTTDASGNFSVGPAAAADLGGLSAGGNIDLEVRVAGRSIPTVLALPDQARDAMSRNPSAAAAPRLRLGDLSTDVGKDSSSISGFRTPSGLLPGPTGQCTPLSTTLMSTSNESTKVGEAHIASVNVSASFTYTSGASSSLGSGYSISGAWGSFSSSGTVTRGWNSTVGFPTTTQGQSRAYYTYFQYGKYKIKCYRLDIGAQDYWYEYSFKPIVLWGGASAVPVSPRTASTCTTYYAGSFQSNETTTAYEWSTGVASNGTIGLNLSSKTGHSSSSKITYTFNATAKLCVVAGASPATAKIALAKP